MPAPADGTIGELLKKQGDAALDAAQGGLADGQVGGKLAQIGARLVEGSARKIADDFFDEAAAPEKAGKKLGKDHAAGKATFVSLLGLSAAKTRARDLVADAEAALSPYGAAAEHLRDVARFVIAREM